MIAELGIPRLRLRLAAWANDPLLLATLSLAALLRLPTLGVQSYWDDEATTVGLLRQGFFAMNRALPKSESTPPSYYVCAWLWSRVFGTGEVGLRALSAIAGIATVGLAYRAGRCVAGRRAARIAALLVAANPLMIWYSQEARAYALAALLCAAAFVFFLEELRSPRPRLLGGWAVMSSLALTSHYFSVFVVAPQALWLLGTSRRRSGDAAAGRRTTAAAGAVAAVGLALLPLALVQRDRGYAFHSVSLATRVAQIPEQLLVGYGVWYTGWGKLLAVGSAALVTWALALVVRPGRRRGLGPPAAVALAGLAAPVALALIGLDYVLTLYFLAAVVPVAVVVAAGLARARAGAVGAAALATVGAGIAVVVATNPTFQREDLRGAARTAGAVPWQRALVVTPPSGLGAYMPHLAPLAGPAAVREIVVIGMPKKDPGRPAQVPRALEQPLDVASFRLVERDDRRRYTVLRFRAPRPVVVTPQQLMLSHLGDWGERQVSVLLQGPS